MSHNVSQILLISKLENLKDDQENINIGIVLNEIMDQYSVLIKNKNIKFSNNLDCEELYIVSRILSNYDIEYRIEKSDIGFVFLIKL